MNYSLLSLYLMLYNLCSWNGVFKWPKYQSNCIPCPFYRPWSSCHRLCMSNAVDKTLLNKPKLSLGFLKTRFQVR